jgi:hypothetical protein
MRRSEAEPHSVKRLVELSRCAARFDYAVGECERW